MSLDTERAVLCNESVDSSETDEMNGANGAGGIPPEIAIVGKVKNLLDGDLVRELCGLVVRSNRLTVELLIHIGEVDARRLYLDETCSSMFVYCTRRLGFAENVAYRRIGAARMARSYPLVLERIASGRIHLTTIALLSPHLNDANHRELLDAAGGKSKRAVQELLAARFPRPDVPDRIRKLPKRRAAVPCEPSWEEAPAGESTVGSRRAGGAAVGCQRATGHSVGSETSARHRVDSRRADGDSVGSQRARDLWAGPGTMVRPPSPSPAPSPAQVARRSTAADDAGPTATLATAGADSDAVRAGASADPGSAQSRACSDQTVPRPRRIAPAAAHAAVVAPLSTDRFKVQFTASRTVVEKLRRAQEMMSHRVPDGDLEQVIELALDGLCERLMKERYATSGQSAGGPEGSVGSPGERPDSGSSRRSSCRNGSRRNESLGSESKGSESKGNESNGAKSKGSESKGNDSSGKDACRSNSRRSKLSSAPVTSASSKGSPASRHIPHAVRRQVIARDGVRCTFVDSSGRRCEERRYLELDHIRPFGMGGAHDAENLRLLCRPHNAQAARIAYGEDGVGVSRSGPV